MVSPLRVARRLFWVLLLTLLAFALTYGLVVAVDLGTRGPTSPGLSPHGRLALTLGVLGGAGLPVGLMRLRFYSSRRGYDR